ncbi:MAG: ABC transporter permease [Anaerolineae bacterium]
MSGNIFTIARREFTAALLSWDGLAIISLFLGTFGIGVQQAASVAFLPQFKHVALAFSIAHSLAWISVPLAGILLGYGTIAEERASGTIHFLASKPVTRDSIILGKFLGVSAFLTFALGFSALLAGAAAWVLTGHGGALGSVVAYVLSLLLLSLVFESVSFFFSTLFSRARMALITAFVAYVGLSVVWQNLFLIGSPVRASSAVANLASPFLAWMNWADGLVSQPQPWKAELLELVDQGLRTGLPFYASDAFFVFVMLVWLALSLLGTLAVFRVRDVA